MGNTGKLRVEECDPRSDTHCAVAFANLTERTSIFGQDLPPGPVHARFCTFYDSAHPVTLPTNWKMDVCNKKDLCNSAGNLMMMSLNRFSFYFGVDLFH